MDNRRVVKWFDIRYHEKSGTFGKLIRPHLEDHRTKISVWERKPNGTSDWVLHYQKRDADRDWQVQLGTGTQVRSVCSYFEDPENISDEEWDLFEICEPELVSWLGKNTLKATDIELMLKGRCMIDVR